MNTIFNDPSISQSATFGSLNSTVATTFQFNQPVTASLIFGDFIAVFKFIAALMSGGIFADAQGIVSTSGYGDQWVSLLMGGLFDLATVFLILYIVSNRSI